MLKISNEVGRTDNFRALARKLSFLQTEESFLISLNEFDKNDDT